MMNAEYWAVVVRLASEAADAVTNWLFEAGAVGVVEEDEGPAIVLRAFFPPTMDGADTRGRIEAYLADLRALAVSVGPATVEVVPVLTEPWADAWRAHFQPIAVGRHLLVCPPWEVPQGAMDLGRLVIVIEPGRAFGTGAHLTTQGCLELLEKALEGRDRQRPSVARVLDVGTGSGVLAIAAARLGVAHVDAIDLDPDAVAAARVNAVRNGVARQLHVAVGTPEAWVGPAADLVLANLLGRAHLALARALARCTTATGGLIAGGLLIPEEPAVVAAFGAEGFRLVERVQQEEWVTLELSRSGTERPAARSPA